MPYATLVSPNLSAMRTSYLDVPAVLDVVKERAKEAWDSYVVKINDPDLDPDDHLNEEKDAFNKVIDIYTDCPSVSHRNDLFHMIIFLRKTGALPPSCVEMMALSVEKSIDYLSTKLVAESMAHDIPDAWRMFCNHVAEGKDFHEEYEVIIPYISKRTTSNHPLETSRLLSNLKSDIKKDLSRNKEVE